MASGVPRESKISGINKAEIANIVLIGGTGSGKSQVGAQLARFMGFGLMDIDIALEHRAGKKVAAIFDAQGEAEFRKLEREFIQSIANIQSHVVVAGAGAVEDDISWDILQKLGILVWVCSPTIEIAGRLLARPEELAKRPKLANILEIEDPKKRKIALRQRLDELMEGRIARYEQAPFSLVTGYGTAESGARQLKKMILNPPSE